MMIDFYNVLNVDMMDFENDDDVTLTTGLAEHKNSSKSSSLNQQQKLEDISNLELVSDITTIS